MAERFQGFADQLEAEIPALRRYSRSLTRSVYDADDLLQATLERALTKRHQFESGTDLRRWLFTIMRHTRINAHRQAKRRGPHVALDDWHPETHRPPRQEKHIELKEVANRLAKLRPEERNVVELSVFRGLKHKQIAERLNVAEGTVKSRLNRARRALAA